MRYKIKLFNKKSIDESDISEELDLELFPKTGKFFDIFKKEFLLKNKGFNIVDNNRVISISGRSDTSFIKFRYVDEIKELLIELLDINMITPLINNVLLTVYDAAIKNGYGSVTYICKDCTGVEKSYFDGELRNQLDSSNRTMYKLILK